MVFSMSNRNIFPSTQKEGLPTVFTQVSKYDNWIKSITEDDKTVATKPGNSKTTAKSMAKEKPTAQTTMMKAATTVGEAAITTPAATVTPGARI